MKRLSDPNSWRFRLDILERFLCLRTFVQVSILAASNLRESCRVLCKWINVAEEIERRLKDLFALVCIVTSLQSPILKHWQGLWRRLKEEHCNEYNLLNGAITRSLQELVTTSATTAGSSVTVPNVMPYVVDALMTVKETSYIIEDLHETMGCSPVPAEPELRLEGFQQNAQVAFRHVSHFDDLLFDLFRTEFHIRLFWGTNGVTDYPHNFNERHTKFAKVLTALATICARQ